jgi:hypothetical protein
MTIGILAVAGLVGDLLAAAFVFDSILRIQFTFYRQDWIRSGKPQGYFYFPEGFIAAINLRDRRASRYFPWKLLITTPYWASDDPKAGRLLLVFRLLGVLSLFLVLSLFVFGFEDV